MIVPDPLATRNECVKLFANFLNAMSVALIGITALRPLVDQMAPTGSVAPGDSRNLAGAIVFWGIIGVVMHLCAHYVLSMISKEVDDDRV